ncbi:MAG: DUF421 domain-containing protein [Rhodopirellula sp. JB044]|uniref:DUF421 domain-containing protein n=1 Tax=Rhodopirellula sp. JB044 TaxID=3342844 RepID=UPI00370B168B
MKNVFEQWTSASLGEVTMVVLSSVVIYAVILAYTRFSGLRSFSKMSASDFAMTVAVGSLFASTISSSNPSLVIGMVALACLFMGQLMLAWLRQRVSGFSNVVDNEPLLLMAGSRMIDENLRKANVTRGDVYGKLREANAFRRDHVLAVVFETTGDISVLHSEADGDAIDREIVSDVIDSELLFTDPGSIGPNSTGS